VGVVAEYVIVVHLGAAVAAGFASFREDSNVPDGGKPWSTQTLNPRSRPPAAVSGDHVLPLFDELTRWPLTYGFESALALTNPAILPQLQK
jgi:hypothetical protein